MERFGGFILFTLQWSLLTFTQFVLSPVTIVIIFVFDVGHDQNLQIAWQSLAHLHFGPSILATSVFFGSPEKEPNASDRGVPRLRDQSKNLQDQSLGWTSRGPKMLPMDAEGFITLRLGLALQSTTNGFCRSLWSGFHQHQIVAIPDIPDIPCFLRCSVLFLWQSNRAQDMMIPNDHCVVFFQHGEQLNGPKKLEAGWRCHWVNLGALVV